MRWFPRKEEIKEIKRFDNPQHNTIYNQVLNSLLKDEGLANCNGYNLDIIL